MNLSVATAALHTGPFAGQSVWPGLRSRALIGMCAGVCLVLSVLCVRRRGLCVRSSAWIGLHACVRPFVRGKVTAVPCRYISLRVPVSIPSLLLQKRDGPDEIRASACYEYAFRIEMLFWPTAGRCRFCE